jgi:Chaperone of endosialidase
MTCTINASTSAGIVQTADLSGGLVLQSNGSSVVNIAPTTLTTTLNSAASNPPFIAQIAGTEAMRIDSSGNVGIGTTSPSTYANGYAPVLAVGTSPNYFIAQGRTDGPTAATNGVRVGGCYSTNPITGSNIFFGAQGGSGQQGIITFNTKSQNDNTTQPAEAMRVTSGGKLAIGSTGGGNGVKLEIVGDTSPDTLTTFKDTRGDGYSGAPMIYWQRNSGTVGTITTTTTSTAYNTSSDYRLKDNIAPMVGALAIVAQLKPVTYKWKTDGSNGQGFIAHELQAVVPDCVTGKKDAIDEEGKPVYQGIDTSFLVATLTAAIQEQQALIESLTTRITALEAK